MTSLNMHGSGIIVQHKLPNLKDKPYGGVWSINDQDAIATVKIEHRPYNTTDLQEFLHDYAAWMQKGHNIHGIGTLLRILHMPMALLRYLISFINAIPIVG